MNIYTAVPWPCYAVFGVGCAVYTAIYSGKCICFRADWAGGLECGMSWFLV